MKEITHAQLMRAIHYHRLNVGNAPTFVKSPYVGVRERWQWLDYEKYGQMVAIEDCPDYYGEESKKKVEQYIRTECTDEFYDKYVKTVPPEVLHCRTCKKFGDCDIQRADAEDYCCGWQ